MLEAIARYYRIFRGSRGLFAESEMYYLRAESSVTDALRKARAEGSASTRWLEELRETIVRGRIELNKREGLGLIGWRLGLMGVQHRLAARLSGNRPKPSGAGGSAGRVLAKAQALGPQGA